MTNNPQLRADLHLHTIYSDSTLTPQDVINAAKAKGLACVAVTDHDTLDGYLPTLKAAEGSGIEVLPAAEFSSQLNKKTVHILGYLMDPDHTGLKNYLVDLKQRRIARMEEMIERLKKIGLDGITISDVAEKIGKASFGRPHLAQVLVDKGFAKNRQAAFEKYLSDTSPGYVSGIFDEPQHVIEIIRKSGGVAVLAHPMLTLVDERIPSFVEAGLGGLEASYPNISDKICLYYEKIARKHGLIVTGGSDAHGDNRGWTHIGKITVGMDVVDALRAKSQNSSIK